MILTLIIILAIILMIAWGEVYVRTEMLAFLVWLSGLATLFMMTCYWMVRLGS